MIACHSWPYDYQLTTDGIHTALSHIQDMVYQGTHMT